MASKPFGFGPERRLRHRRAFDRVFAARARRVMGPIVVLASPNEFEHSRLGMVVPRRVGNAVQRNQIKRMLREAFRLSQDQWPGRYDVVVQVRPHPPAGLAEYQRLLTEGMERLHKRWQTPKT